MKAELLSPELGETAEAFLDGAPSKLLLDAIRRWGQERGTRLYNPWEVGRGAETTPFSSSSSDFLT